MTYDEFVAIALAMPDVEEGLAYGDAAAKRAGRTMFALHRSGESVSLKLDWDNRDRLLDEHPEVLSINDHLVTWPWLHVSLPGLSPDLAEELIRLSYDDAPKPGKRRAAG